MNRWVPLYPNVDNPIFPSIQVPYELISYLCNANLPI